MTKSSFPNACVGIKFEWIEFKRALHGPYYLIGVMCRDALNNPVTLQDLRALDLRHKHSEMTNTCKFVGEMNHSISCEP